MALADAAPTIGGTKQIKQKQSRANTAASSTLASIVGKKIPQSKASSDNFIVGDIVTMYGTDMEWLGHGEVISVSKEMQKYYIEMSDCATTDVTVPFEDANMQRVRLGHHAKP